MECVCFPVTGALAENRGPRAENRGPRAENRGPGAENRGPPDLCKIVERTRRHEQSAHDDRECHSRGEVRQNIINKLKMFLDDCDDRPVLRRSGGGAKPAGAGGQSGLGPMIKYPGYVDYGHPYFSSPYDRMPELAATVARRGGTNPCPPIEVRNWAARGATEAMPNAAGREREANAQAKDCCRCAQRRSEPPTCPAACKPTSGKPISGSSRPQLAPLPIPQPATGALPGGGLRYICVPLPRD